MFDCKQFDFISWSSTWYIGDSGAYIIAFSGDVHHVRFLLWFVLSKDGTKKKRNLRLGSSRNSTTDNVVLGTFAKEKSATDNVKWSTFHVV